MANWTKFNNQIEGHLARTGSTFIAGNRITIADFVVFATYASMAINEFTEGTEHIQAAFAATLESTPKVREYIERMKTELAGHMSQRSGFNV